MKKVEKSLVRGIVGVDVEIAHQQRRTGGVAARANERSHMTDLLAQRFLGVVLANDRSQVLRVAQEDVVFAWMSAGTDTRVQHTFE